MQLKNSFRKGCQIFVAHMEEATRDTVESIEDHPILKYFKDDFGEIVGLPPKRDIDLSIDLVPGASPTSKKTYRMGTLELNNL
jgi:hypothetical protein